MKKEYQLLNIVKRLRCPYGEEVKVKSEKRISKLETNHNVQNTNIPNGLGFGKFCVWNLFRISCFDIRIYSQYVTPKRYTLASLDATFVDTGASRSLARLAEARAKRAKGGRSGHRHPNRYRFNYQAPVTRHQQLGFTLVEMLLYMALFSIFLFILTDMFVSILDVQRESESSSAVAQDGQFILARLSYDYRGAQSVTEPGSLGASSSQLQLIKGGTTYTYSLSGDDLRLQVGLDPVESLNGFETKVSGLSFQKFGTAGGKETVKVEFTVTGKVKRRNKEEIQSYQTTFSKR